MPSNQPTSKPSRTVITRVAVRQIILGVSAATAMTQAFLNAFIAAILATLPKGSQVVITSVQLYYDDGSIENQRRTLLRAVIGAQINYVVSSPLASMSVDILQSILTNPASVTTMNSLLALSYPQGTKSNNIDHPITPYVTHSNTL